LGICIGNVLTPGYIKKNFPKQIGLMTGIFSIMYIMANITKITKLILKHKNFDK